MIKKFISALAFGILITSCNTGDDVTYAVDLLPVNSVEMPTLYAKDSITEIPVKYIRPTSCHFFDSFYYDKSEFTRTVAIYSVIVNQDGCQTDNQTLVEVPLRFKPAELGTYHFRFWTGEDAQGVNQYIEHDVVVDH
jgi:hypothetical protein